MILLKIPDISIRSFFFLLNHKTNTIKMHYNYLKVGIILELAYTQSQVFVITTFCLKIFYKDKHIWAQSTFIH